MGGLRLRLLIAEFLNQLFELVGHFGQLFSGHLRGGCSRSGVLGPGCDAGDAIGDFRAPTGHLGHGTADFVGSCGLLLDRTRDRVLNFVDPLDDGPDFPDRRDRTPSVI